MIPRIKASEITLKQDFFTKTQSIKITESLGYVLAENVQSRIDLPPFDRASMDGFAYIKDDDSKKFEIIETIPAGYIPQKRVEKGQCSKIMTGAKVSDGADYLIRVEFTKEEDGYMIPTRSEFKYNIAKKAENLSEGDTILTKGTLISSKEIAVMANIGVAEVKVSKMPVIGIINTGDEIVEPWETAKPGQIFNGNGSSMISILKSMNITPTYYGIIPDDEELTDKAVKKALIECDILFLSGGVSMGEFDFVPKILKQNGVEIMFDRVAVKPGKPTTFGKKENSKYVFGMPGNPVSTFVIFELFAKPFIYKMLGHEYKPRYAYLTLSKDIKRKIAEREEYLPVKIDGTTCTPLKYHGSAHINALVHADGLLCLCVDKFEEKEGTIVKVRLI